MTRSPASRARCWCTRRCTPRSSTTRHRRPAGAAERAAENDVHRVLRGSARWGRSDRSVNERARAQTVVRAALGRSPKIRRPLQVAAYEPTHQATPSSRRRAAGRRGGGAARSQRRRRRAQGALGPVAEDDAATRTLKVALQLLAGRSSKAAPTRAPRSATRSVR